MTTTPTTPPDATPTPWRAHHEYRPHHDYFYIVGADGKFGALVTRAAPHGSDTPSLRAFANNTGLVFRAVNSHDAHVKALEDALELAEANVVSDTPRGYELRLSSIREIIRAALTPTGAP